jgi:hypothetical protein
MVDILLLGLSGIYLLLLMSLGFNFLLAMRIQGVKAKVAEAEVRSIEEAKMMEARLNKIKEEIVHRKGLVL